MKLALIGVGQAGGKIVDKLIEYNDQTGSGIIQDCIAVNTAKQDLRGLSNIPEEKRLLIGQSRVKGNGVGADNELGAEVAQADSGQVLDAINDIATHTIDAFLVVAALGGGTGSGGAPVIARELDKIYTEPIYGFGVLPSSEEGSIYTLNAARSFQTLVSEVDNLIVFDNDAWRKSGESVGEGYEAINLEIARRFGILFGAGEVQDGEVAESVVDASEVINTLSGGGVSTIGYATDEIERETKSGLLSRFSDDGGPDPTETTNRITSLVRKSTLGRLTLPANVGSTERALLVTAGPKEYLNRKGIERGRKWLEGETDCMEVRGGDYPLPNSGEVACGVLLSGVHNIPRVKELQEVAVEADERREELQEQSDAKLEDLVEDDDGGELDDLF